MLNYEYTFNPFGAFPSIKPFGLSLVVNCLSLQVNPLSAPANYSTLSRQNRRCVMPVAICSLVTLTARPMRYDQPKLRRVCIVHC